MIDKIILGIIIFSVAALFLAFLYITFNNPFFGLFLAFAFVYCLSLPNTCQLPENDKPISEPRVKIEITYYP